jgi:hypothetical protein
MSFFATQFARVDERLNLMNRMFERLGIDFSLAARIGCGTSLRRATRTCATCRQTGSCEAWLAGDGAPAARYQFCPNARLLDEMRP